MCRPQSTPQWRDDEEALTRWKQGTTGMPLVDANMRELAATGWMSNRGRQNVASYLILDLGIDWRRGADHFESLLLDYDTASNWGNWVAAAGLTGGRLNKFNITKQSRDYDANGDYLRAWLPELAEVPTEYVLRSLTVSTAQHSSALAGTELGVPYAGTSTFRRTCRQQCSNKQAALSVETIQRRSRLPVGMVHTAEEMGVAKVAAVAAVHGRADVTTSATRQSKRDATGDRGSRESRVAGQVKLDGHNSGHAPRSVAVAFIDAYLCINLLVAMTSSGKAFATLPRIFKCAHPGASSLSSHNRYAVVEPPRGYRLSSEELLTELAENLLFLRATLFERDRMTAITVLTRSFSAAAASSSSS